MNTQLPDALKKTLKDAFATVHQAPGVTPDMAFMAGGTRNGESDYALGLSRVSEGGVEFIR